MKRVISIICAVMLTVMFSVTCFAQGKMYPHADVQTDMTVKEGEDTASSGRVWKTVSGKVTREDMEHGELRYTVYLPEDYDSSKEYPFLLYLHGGSIGYHRSNGKNPWTADLGNSNYAESIANSIKDCIIFAPQAPGAPQEVKDAKSAYWSEYASGMVAKFTVDNSASSPYLRAVEKMMEDFLAKGISHSGNVYTVDASRLYVCGHSMGGIGVYTILRDCPDMFAAALVGAGVGDPESVDLWKSTPVRIVHGTKDSTISYKAAELMAEALKDNPNAEIVPLESVGHDIKPYLYGAGADGTNQNFVWMASKQREKASDEGKVPADKKQEETWSENLKNIPKFEDGAGNLTREEFAYLIVNIFDLKQKDGVAPAFADIEDSKYKNDIAIAYSNGIIKGTSDTTFEPTGQITRQEITVMLYRAWHLLYPEENFTVTNTYTFSDEAQISDWAKEAVVYMYDKKIMIGTSTETPTISPLDNIIRDHAMILMERIVEFCVTNK